MPDYSKGKIYKLVSPSGLTYVGSTTQPLYDRKGGHKGNYKRWKEGKRTNCSSFQLFDEAIDDIEIILIEDYPCETKEELHKRERHWVKRTTCVNKQIPSRTKQEYGREYYQKNKDRIREKHSDYQREYNAKYREKNKVVLAEKHRKYNKEHKDEINAKRNVKTNCECGGSYTLRNKACHERSIKHQDYINSLSE